MITGEAIVSKTGGRERGAHKIWWERKGESVEKIGGEAGIISKDML